MHHSKLVYLLLIVLSLFCLQIHSEQKTKEAPKEILFGQSAFLSPGSLQLYGELIRNAITARFNRVNKSGGIRGKKLRLVSMDDRGEAPRTAQNIDLW